MIFVYDLRKRFKQIPHRLLTELALANCHRYVVSDESQRLAAKTREKRLGLTQMRKAHNHAWCVPAPALVPSFSYIRANKPWALQTAGEAEASSL
jgi:hypothetical protein